MARQLRSFLPTGAIGAIRQARFRLPPFALKTDFVFCKPTDIGATLKSGFKMEIPVNTMIKAIKLPIAFLGICLCLWGCATSHATAGRNFDSSKISQIVKGKTTSDEIITMFGTPYSKQPEADDAERWIYSYATATGHAQSFFVTNVATTGYKKDLNILINKDKVVVNFTLDDGPFDTHTTAHPF